jgi:hypothetical protein
MTVPPTKDGYFRPSDVELIADPYPRSNVMRERCTTTSQKETVS